MSLRAFVVALAALAAGPAPATEPPPPTPAGQGRLALGLELDALPFVLSAAAREPGGAGNLWIGLDRLRLRAVGAHLAFPAGLTPAGFVDRELTVAAGIVDGFFRPGFDGPWIGAGLEYWWNTIGSPSGPSTAAWSSWVATLGGGFAWKFWGDLYLNPWAAGHLLLSRPSVTLYGETWTPQAVSGEVSIKLGWSFRP